MLKSKATIASMSISLLIWRTKIKYQWEKKNKTCVPKGRIFKERVCILTNSPIAIAFVFQKIAQ